MIRTVFIAAPLVVFAVGPVLLLLAGALAGDLPVMSTLVEDRGAMVETLTVASGAALFAIGVGTPLSVLLYRTDLPWSRFWTALFSSSLAVPPFIWGMGWISLANPKTGFLNQWLPVFDIYSTTGIAFVLGTSGLPLVLLSAAAAFRRIDSSLEEAARLCGASAFRAFMSATFPLVLPSLLSGATLVFLLGASAFGVPYMLGTVAVPPTRTLTTRIYEEVLLGGGDHVERALILATALLALATAVLLANRWLGAAGRVQVAMGKGTRADLLRLGALRPWMTGAVGVLASVVVLLPLTAIALASLRESAGAPWTFESLSFVHWRDVLLQPRTVRAALRSSALAFGAGVVIAAFGTAVAVAGRRGRLGRTLETVAQWPYAVPGTVLAMALIVAFSMNYRVVFLESVSVTLLIASSSWLLLIAYAAKYLALGTRNVAESLEQLDASLPESARMCGATPWRAFRDAVLPLLWPAIVGAFVVSFMLCATELTISVLLVPPGTEVLGTLLFELQTYADPGAASVLACGFVILVLVAFSLAYGLRTERAHG